LSLCPALCGVYCTVGTVLDRTLVRAIGVKDPKQRMRLRVGHAASSVHGLQGARGGCRYPLLLCTMRCGMAAGVHCTRYERPMGDAVQKLESEWSRGLEQRKDVRIRVVGKKTHMARNHLISLPLTSRCPTITPSHHKQSTTTVNYTM
jgi:hypothetical protein